MDRRKLFAYRPNHIPLGMYEPWLFYYPTTLATYSTHMTYMYATQCTKKLVRSNHGIFSNHNCCFWITNGSDHSAGCDTPHICMLGIPTWRTSLSVQSAVGPHRQAGICIIIMHHMQCQRQHRPWTAGGYKEDVWLPMYVLPDPHVVYITPEPGNEVLSLTPQHST